MDDTRDTSRGADERAPHQTPEEAPYDASPGYGQGYPPAGAGWGGQPGAQPRSGLGVAALVVGIGALLLSWLPVLGTLIALGGVALGVVAMVRARRTDASTAMPVIGTVLSGAAVLVSLLLLLLVALPLVVALGDEDQTSAPGVPSPSPSTAPRSSPTASSTPSPSTTAPSPQAPGGSRPLALGATAVLGDYTVTVTTLDPDANDVAADSLGINEPPGGRYVEAEVTVVYGGAETVRPSSEVRPTFLGSDSLNYDQAFVYLADDRRGDQDVRGGGTVTYPVFFDVPPDAIAAGAVELKVGYGADDPTAVWAVPAS